MNKVLWFYLIKLKIYKKYTIENVTGISGAFILAKYLSQVQNNFAGFFTILLLLKVKLSKTK